VSLSEGGAPWNELDTSTMTYGAVNWPVVAPDRANYRMLGLADLACALKEGRAPRASGDLALHVLEVMEAILTAGETGSAQMIVGAASQPKELGEDEAKRLLA
jgi:predicted dehydrogenase